MTRWRGGGALPAADNVAVRLCCCFLPPEALPSKHMFRTDSYCTLQGEGRAGEMVRVVRLAEVGRGRGRALLLTRPTLTATAFSTSDRLSFKT
jgi:hypothetical protein